MSGVRRGIVITIIGLALAFGVFYWAGWPSRLDGPGPGNEISFADEQEPGSLLHAGLGPITLVGRRDASITSVRLEQPTPGIELVDVRLSMVGEPGFVSLGSARGPRPDIEALPHGAGAALRSGQRVFFIVTFRALGTGRFRFPGLRVSYKTGWLTRSEVFGPSVTVNVGATPTPP